MGGKWPFQEAGGETMVWVSLDKSQGSSTLKQSRKELGSGEALCTKLRSWPGPRAVRSPRRVSNKGGPRPHRYSTRITGYSCRGRGRRGRPGAARKGILQKVTVKSFAVLAKMCYIKT